MSSRNSPLRWLFDARLRAVAGQVLLALALLWLVWTSVDNALVNMARQGMKTGFSFLDTVAGFDLSLKLIDFSPASTYRDALWAAVLNTLLVSVIGIVLATVLGFAVGIARLSGNRLLAQLTGAYVEFARNIPLLLFVFFWYFGVLRALPPPRQGYNPLPGIFLNNRGLSIPSADAGPGLWPMVAIMLAAWGTLWLWRAYRRRHPERYGAGPPLSGSLALGLGLPFLALVGGALAARWDMPSAQGFNIRGGIVLGPELVALSLALTSYTAAFIAEIVRGGILAVPDGQREAARALGLSPGKVLRLVVLPQALRIIIPPLGNQYLNLIKNSSYGAIIAFPELFSVYGEKTLTQTGQAVEPIAIVLAVYLAINLTVSALLNWYNRHIRLVTR